MLFPLTVRPEKLNREFSRQAAKLGLGPSSPGCQNPLVSSLSVLLPQAGLTLPCHHCDQSVSAAQQWGAERHKMSMHWAHPHSSLNALTLQGRLQRGLQTELGWVEGPRSSGAQAGGWRDPCAEALLTCPSLPQCPRLGGIPWPWPAWFPHVRGHCWVHKDLLCYMSGTQQGTESDAVQAWVLLPAGVWLGWA